MLKKGKEKKPKGEGKKKKKSFKATWDDSFPLEEEGAKNRPCVALMAIDDGVVSPSSKEEGEGSSSEGRA